MAKKNVLLLCGGGGTEHAVSLRSAHFLKEQLSLLPQVEQLQVELPLKGPWKVLPGGEEVELRSEGLYFLKDKRLWPVHYVIPCIHGRPGETGEIQCHLEVLGLPYFGPGHESSTLCFNKISTKLWLTALGVPNTPYMFLRDPKDLGPLQSFFQAHGEIFIKASSQGSAVGVFHVKEWKDAADRVRQAFELSPYVLVEKRISGRELEVATYEYKGKLEVTVPGEIALPGGEFYSYEEKYDKKSRTETRVVAPGLDQDQVKKIRQYAEIAFRGMKLRHLSRVDFFLTPQGEIYLNEINTFPGMTEISMFPKMMQNAGHSFKDFLGYFLEGNA